MVQRIFDTRKIIYNNSWERIQVKSKHIRFVKLTQAIHGDMYVLWIYQQHESIAPKPGHFWWAYNFINRIKIYYFLFSKTICLLNILLENVSIYQVEISRADQTNIYSNYKVTLQQKWLSIKAKSF